jgi:ABC-type transport system substrate-binding protein
MNVDVGNAVAKVEQGTFDLVMENDPALSRTAAAARNAGARYRWVPNEWISMLALNTSRPLFSGDRVRRAVAYGIDRRTLAGEDGLATSHLLPPAFPGFNRTPAYAVTPDLPAARSLIGGRQLHAVLAAYDPAADPVAAALADAVRAQFAALGITVTIVPLRGDDDPRTAWTLAHADLATVARNASQTVDPATYLAGLPYLPAADRARLEQIAGLPSPLREIAAARLAERLERDAVYVAYEDGAIPELVSKRLGCLVHQPQYPGVDLAALCIRHG